MCGIFGYFPPEKEKHHTTAVCLKGLATLEYRGYDSSGIAGIDKGEMHFCKKAGKVGALQKALHEKNYTFSQAIGHTRWATHGRPLDKNAHPHLDKDHTLALVHNGIIENHEEIRQYLAPLHLPSLSDTDSECIVQLLASKLSQHKGSLLHTLQESLPLLQGTFALALLHKGEPDCLFATARECPLAIAKSHNTGAIFLSSDIHALPMEEDLTFFFLENDEIALIRQGEIEVYSSSGERIVKPMEPMGISICPISKEGYPHFMLKEIFEQPTTIRQALQGRFDEENGSARFPELGKATDALTNISSIVIIACGTSWHAGCIAAQFLEKWVKIPARAAIASEFRYQDPLISPSTLVIAMSQSGETADTLGALRLAKERKALTLGICNVEHSTLARESHYSLLLRAGPEICVCSTKAFTSQIALLSLFSLFLGRLKGLSKERGTLLLEELKCLPLAVDKTLRKAPSILTIAKKYAHYHHFFFLGRGVMYPTCLEASLKLKEITYCHASAYPGGELKHGPIALIDPSLPSIALCGDLHTYEKMVSNLKEIEAREGPILAFAPKNSPHLKEIVQDLITLPSLSYDPLNAIPYAIATQLFAYYVAREKGREIDQPRNLAKAVTVE